MPFNLRHFTFPVSTGEVPFVGMEYAAEFHGDSRMNITPAQTSPNLQQGGVVIWHRRVRWPAGEIHYLLGAGANDNNSTRIFYTASGQIQVELYENSASPHTQLVTQSPLYEFQDNEWRMVLVAFDYGNPVESERAKIFVNDAEVAYQTEARPSGDASIIPGLFTAGAPQNIGARHDASNYFIGVMGEINIVSGVVPIPGDFGEFDGPNWVWKRYTGPWNENGQQYTFEILADLGNNTAT